jgi:hypothetical protein
VNPLQTIGLEWLGALALFLAFIVLIRYLDHRERMAMIARGIEPPQRARKLLGRPGSAALRGGLITAMVGLAVTIGLYTLGYLLPAPFSAVPGKLGPWLLPGLIPLAVGAALVASHYLAAPHPSHHAADQEAPSTYEPPALGAADSQQGWRRRGWRLLSSETSSDADESSN